MFEPGDVLGDRYQIEGPLGQGGMAHVFAARDLHLERQVALKVLRPHLTEADSERFRREIRALAQLSHPGIVTIFDLGQGEHVYFAMERIEGGPFTDLGPWEGDVASQGRLLRAAISVAETLGYVHELGMVHRDLTPRNILLPPHGSPKVMDFGLVQLTESSRELTRTGFTLGTPQYMAPEQATGEATGGATDLYAFGVVLYRTVTGVAPFDADNDQAVLYQHVYGDVVPAIERNPLVPPSLSDLISTLLEKAPAQRPSSGYEVAEALRSVMGEVRLSATQLPAAGAARCGYYPSGPAAPRSLHERWRVRLDQGPQWPAGLAAAEGFLLAGLRSDTLAVLRPADGGVHDRFELRDEVSLPPAYANGRIWVASRDGALAEIAWPRGETVWQGEGVDAVGLALVQDGLLLTRREGSIERWTAQRELRWHVDLNAPAATPPLIHRGEVIALDADGGLVAVSLGDGTTRFRADLGVPPSPPAASSGMVLLLERSGELHGFSLAERDTVWSYGLEGDAYGGPAIWNGRVYAASWARTLHCLSLASGDDVWSQPLPAAVTASPVVASGVAWVVTEGGEVLGFDARDGTPRARARLGAAPIQAPPLPVHDTLVVAATDGTVVAYR
ncbi:MAG: serine/threonine-protein kinase [Trueperaceae bacterium]|nr:serine/threonine-protein kinase [Trueperaceae bacterium]